MANKKHSFLNTAVALELLRGLAMFGHQTGCLFALTNFSHLKEGSRKTTAARDLKKLGEAGLIRAVCNATGSTSYVLTASGADLWNDSKGDEIYAVAGHKQSINGPTFKHRQIASAYLASQLGDPRVKAVVTEYEMLAGSTPLNMAALIQAVGKLPDGFIIRDQKGKTTWDHELDEERTDPDFRVFEWVEVESTFKSAKESEKILRAAIALSNQNYFVEFDRPFNGLVGKQGGIFRLTIVAEEAEFIHITRLDKAIDVLEKNHLSWQEQESWKNVKAMMRMATVPFKRHSITLNGEVNDYEVTTAQEQIRRALEKRAAREMTAKERKEVSQLKSAWVADYEERMAVRKASGLPPVWTEIMPDFGFALRQKRPMSRRPQVDCDSPRGYPEPRRRRII